jgi:putative flavoprotein involved in K+ transport
MSADGTPAQRAATDEAEDRVDVVVVGAGQAGLAVGHHLHNGGGVRYTVLEAGDCVGGAWLGRWDSLELFTPARFSSLPGRPFPGDPNHYPRRAEVAAYLQDYAAGHAMPVRLSTRVDRVERIEQSGHFLVHTNRGAIAAPVVVIATGAFQRPALPSFADELDPAVVQLHTSEYRNPQQLPPGRALVVGAGNSGLQVAADISDTHEVHLSVGSKQMAIPRRVLGQDIFWWLDRLGFTRAPLDKLPSWLAGDGAVLIGQTVKGTARRRGLSLRPRTTAARGDRLLFADGTDVQPATVIWATGYRSDYSWLPQGAAAPDGRPAHRRGVSAVSGLLYVGLENQATSASSLLGWVQHDAAYVVAQAHALLADAASSAASPRS